MEDAPDPIPLSALQHWQYCPRQCGLIHLEQVFDDNVHTLRGQAVHAKADQPGVETAKGVRVERALPLWHDGLGLTGTVPGGHAWKARQRRGLVLRQFAPPPRGAHHRAVAHSRGAHDRRRAADAGQRAIAATSCPRSGSKALQSLLAE